MKQHPFAVRLDDEQAGAVTAMAKRFGVKEIDVIRWAIDALIAYVEKHKGHLHLPIDFDALWQKIVLTAPEKAGKELAPFKITHIIDQEDDLSRVAEEAPKTPDKRGN